VRSHAAPAVADAVAARRTCAAKHELAQVLRNAGKLVEAREALVACSQAACQTAVRADCVGWFDQVNDTIPTVVLSAKTGSKDEVNARVAIDARTASLRTDGKPIELNPGVHVVRFENPPFDPIEQQILLVPGEKNRVVSVTFGELESAPETFEAKPAVAPTRDAPTALLTHRPIPTVGYVLGGVAVVGAATFAGLALWGQDQRNSLESSCRPVCAASRVNGVHTKFVAADVSLGVAAAAAVAAGIVYFARPAEPLPSAQVGQKPYRTGPTAHLVLSLPAKGLSIGMGGQF
jgi:hypothetical protein